MYVKAGKRNKIELQPMAPQISIKVSMFLIHMANPIISNCIVSAVQKKTRSVNFLKVNSDFFERNEYLEPLVKLLSSPSNSYT